MHGNLGDYVEYNKLTKKLLEEGYTSEKYPNNVKLPGGVFGKTPLENIYGGFEYQRRYIDEMVYQTGCGKFVMGGNVIESLGYIIDWSHENNNPVVRCPYYKAECEKNNPLLHGTHGGALSIQCWCECHKTDETYNYENSIEKANEERKQERERKYQEYSNKHHGRVCREHMYFNECNREWNQVYQPTKCASSCYKEFCPIRGKEIDKKKGNVYYDLKTSNIRNDGTLFDGDEIVSIRKGIRFFERSVSMDICKDFIKLQSDEIYRKYEINEGVVWKQWNKTFKAEVINIRAESRPSRDLMQDLEDIKAGISITHESDRIKRDKENKKQRREDAKQKKVEKLEKKILEVGYENITDNERYHVDKVIDFDRITELEKERNKPKPVQPKQMNIMDFLGGAK